MLSLAQSPPAYHRRASVMVSLRKRSRATATFADPCTGARKADDRSGAGSPRGIDCGQFVGARVPPPPGAQATGGDWLLPANQLGSEKIRCFGPSPLGHAKFHYASLRTTSGVMLSKNRAEKVHRRIPGDVVFCTGRRPLSKKIKSAKVSEHYLLKTARSTSLGMVLHKSTITMFPSASRSAMMPEPTTASCREAVPRNSASRRCWNENVLVIATFTLTGSARPALGSSDQSDPIPFADEAYRETQAAS